MLAAIIQSPYHMKRGVIIIQPTSQAITIISTTLITVETNCTNEVTQESNTSLRKRAGYTIAQCIAKVTKPMMRQAAVLYAEWTW